MQSIRVILPSRRKQPRNRGSCGWIRRWRRSHPRRSPSCAVGLQRSLRNQVGGQENGATNRAVGRVTYSASGRCAEYGRHAEATAAADALVVYWPSDNYVPYACGCVYSLAAKAVKDDAALTDRYGTRAVVLFRQAITAGYTVAPKFAENPDFDALRRREDFRAGNECRGRPLTCGIANEAHAAVVRHFSSFGRSERRAW